MAKAKPRELTLAELLDTCLALVAKGVPGSTRVLTGGCDCTGEAGTSDGSDPVEFVDESEPYVIIHRKDGY